MSNDCYLIYYPAAPDTQRTVGIDSKLIVDKVNFVAIDNPTKIIVAGKIYVVSGKRDEFINRSVEAVAQARSTQGCIDFAVSVDPLEPERVNVLEVWETEKALHEFRDEGPGDDLSQLIESADVVEYHV